MSEIKPMNTITFEFPLFDTHEHAAERVEKIKEELIEVNAELSTEQVNLINLITEAQDVLQASIGLFYNGMLQTLKRKDKAKAATEILLTEINEDHIKKIDKYINERCWERL